jgi:sec-independent protein translocase protein TatA
MIGDLFDSPWKILIVAIVLIVLFGSKKLPHAARSLGQSMRILKKEVQFPGCLRCLRRFPAARGDCRQPAARPVAGADRCAAAADP